MPGVLAGFPFRTQAAHRFAETNRQRSDGFETLRCALRQASIAFAAYFGEQWFAVAQDAGERVVQLRQARESQADGRSAMLWGRVLRRNE
jgi:hypothetical protein